jgi:hypothetical protein
MTVADLLTNNTSASSVFPGWPNGLPPARPISKLPLGVPQLVLAHRCDWWGGTSHPNIGINVADPVYAAATVADMKSRGIGGTSSLWHGAGSLEDKAVRALLPELVKQNMKLVICVGSSTPSLKLPPEKYPTFTMAQRTTALLQVMDYLRDTFMTSPAYLKVGGRPMVQFFGVTGVDWNVVRAHIQGYPVGNPLLYFRWETNYSAHPQADGYFGWTHCDEAWVTGVKKLGKGIIMGANARFDNTVAGDPVRCTWGADHPTKILSNGGTNWLSQIALAKAHTEIPILMLTTWNDYQEGSAIEMGIASEFVPVLSLDKNDLMVQPLPPMFDHYDLYLVNPDNSLKLLDTIASPNTKALMLSNYLLPYGSYTFYLHAVGKNSIQNVLSSPLTATVGWS